MEIKILRVVGIVVELVMTILVMINYLSSVVLFPFTMLEMLRNPASSFKGTIAEEAMVPYSPPAVSGFIVCFKGHGGAVWTVLS